MSTLMAVTKAVPKFQAKEFLVRHPLVGYFLLAFGITWLLFIPIVLSQRGFDLLPWQLPNALILVFFILATYLGPLCAALAMTNITEGKEGLHTFLSRFTQWQVGIRWYLLVLVGYPLVFLAGISSLQPVGVTNGTAGNISLLLTLYLPTILVGMLISSLGEEPGWRGFALPRLQAHYGALVGSLILGALQAFWYTPAYLVRGPVLDSGFDLTVYIANSLVIVASTIIWTWLFNNTGGSIFFAMFVHSVSNATSSLLPQLLPGLQPDPWVAFKITGAIALIVIIFTRGTLSYTTKNKDELRVAG